MTIIKWIWRNILAILGVLQLIVSIISGLLRIFGIESIANITIDYHVIFKVLLCTLIFSAFLFIKNILKRIGVREAPLNFFIFLKKFNPYISSYQVRCLHEFYHEKDAAIKEVKRLCLTSINSLEAKSQTAKLLQKCQNDLKVITGVDFSINIKLFEYDYPKMKKGLNSAHLVTYERFSSRKEKSRMQNSNLKKRNNDEKFKIKLWNKGIDEKSRVLEARVFAEQHPNNKKCKRNSAYDFVLGPSKHYWLSNNLKKDMEDGVFFSSSNNFKDYYNSLGVFLIAPPFECGEYVHESPILGLIIFDSMKKNVMHMDYSRNLMGIYSHLFYEYFLSYNDVNKLINK